MSRQKKERGIAVVSVRKINCGTILICDDAFTCINNGAQRKVLRDYDQKFTGGGHKPLPMNSRSRLYIRCKEGRHYLDGQIDDIGYYGKPGTHYVGFWLKKAPKK